MPKIMTRKEAKANGLKHYYTGTPCKNGHIDMRRQDNGDCLSCRKENFAKWYETNIDKARARARENYYSDIDRRRKQSLDRYHSDPLAALEKNRDWRKRNPEKARAISLKRKTRLRNSGGALASSDIQWLLQIQKCKCANCKKPIRQRYHVDHIMPIALGGKNERRNIQLLCPRCNQSKHAKHPIRWAQENGRLL